MDYEFPEIEEYFIYNPKEIIQQVILNSMEDLKELKFQEILLHIALQVL
jgi:hypothetical protein